MFWITEPDMIELNAQKSVTKVLVLINLVTINHKTCTVFSALGVPASVMVLTLIWVCNGLACSPGWPASAVIMKKVKI